MRALTLVLLFSLWGCSESVSGLPGGNTVDLGAPDSGVAQGPDGGAPDGGGELSCADFEVDLDARNRSQLTRLGFALSATVLLGRMQAPRMLGDRLQASMQITAVGRGHDGLVGMELLVQPDDAFVAAHQFPLDVALGFASSQLPVIGAGAPSLGAPLAMVPVQDSWDLLELLKYPNEGAPFVAEVSVLGASDGRLELQVHEVLAGEMPQTVHVNRNTSLVDPYPMPGDERFLVSFSHVTLFEPDNIWLGSVVDWRTSTQPARATVQAALAAPRRDFDAPQINTFAEDYRLGWTFHQAPMVVAATFTGRVEECCTGAGGTYVQYGAVESFRDVMLRSSFQVGGHAYYPEEACGDSRLFAAGLLISEVPSDRFSCEPTQSWESYAETTRVFAMREDTPAVRSQVEGWVAAQGPLLRAYDHGAELGPDDVAQIGSNAPWSTPLSVAQGLAAGELAWFRVLSTARRSDGIRVRIETTLSPYRFDHLERHRLQLDFQCGDPRLLEVGREGLMPFVAERRWGEEPGSLPDLFFVPGLIFDVHGPAERVHSEVERQLRTSD